MYRYKNLNFRFSADTCTSTFVTANIFPWYLLIRENFGNEAVLEYSAVATYFVSQRVSAPHDIPTRNIQVPSTKSTNI